MRVLTLNLHCHQEPDAEAKLRAVARAIAENSIDVICLQEAAQHKESPAIEVREGITIKADNAAHLISAELLAQYGLDYDFVWDFAHYGWNVWEEGVAILTRGEISNFRSEWLSESRDQTDWLSRKAVFAEVEIDGLRVEIVSAHLGWWNYERESFAPQFEKLYSLSVEDRSKQTIIGGDFNVPAGFDGYNFMMNNEDVVDTFVAVNPEEMFTPTFLGNIDGWGLGDPEGMRIDYILGIGLTTLAPVNAQRMFDGINGEVVSDHFGVMVEFSNTHLAQHTLET